VPGLGVRGLKGGSVGAAGGGWMWERTFADAEGELMGALARSMTAEVVGGWGAAGAAVGRVRHEETAGGVEIEMRNTGGDGGAESVVAGSRMVPATRAPAKRAKLVE
jgi:hypothetical protein